MKLGDFGLSKMMGSQTDFAQSAVGTPYYLSPELCEGKPYNHKSDVWAIGYVFPPAATFCSGGGSFPVHNTNPVTLSHSRPCISSNAGVCCTSW